MKSLIKKSKDLFKGLKTRIEKITGSTGFIAVSIFMIYISLVTLALCFLAGLFKTFSLWVALTVCLGSYASVQIIYKFIKDFIMLIEENIKSSNKQ